MVKTDVEKSKARDFFKSGIKFYNMKNYQRAIYDFSVAIQNYDKLKEPKRDLAEYHYYAGLQFFELNQFDEALQNFEHGSKE